MNALRTLRLLALAAVGVTAGVAHASTFYSCPFGTGTGDHIDRGFYVTNYPGPTLQTVKLKYIPGNDGLWTLSLTARLNSFDGPVIGDTQTVTVDIEGDTFVTFDFGNASLPLHSTVTFTQQVVAQPGPDATIYYDTGVGPCTNVTQTNGTEPPLDTDRRDSVGVTVTGSPLPIPPMLGQVTVVEYYYPPFDHYFMTADPTEISILDAHTPPFEDWVRTGYTFAEMDAAHALSGSADICRFFNASFAPKSSHFFAAQGLGCEETIAHFPDWQLETLAAFSARIPDSSGTCPSGVPIYRLYNNGMGGAPNHRFVTNVTQGLEMIAQGWVYEEVAMCALFTAVSDIP